MQHTKGNTILVTGGASGIGLAFSSRLAAAGNTVIVCGRRLEQLAEAKRLFPALHTLQADVSSAAGRVALVKEAVAAYPALNVLVNNAGIQNRPPPLKEEQDWATHASELEINLHAPMHLSMLFLKHLQTQPNPVIINVTSGLAFVPIAAMSTYCATKAALHSFTLSLRQQLAGSVAVVEIVPPAVNTDLGGKGLHDYGVPLEVYADATFARLLAGEVEIGHSFSDQVRQASRAELNEFFGKLNGPALHATAGKKE
eukprot:m.145660 g.145660  ORF g.145660 m.145660 type:complete len:256 (-) comp15026_c0_seq2:185-952(-)